MSRDGTMITRRDLLWFAGGAATASTAFLLSSVFHEPRSAETVEEVADAAAVPAAVLGGKYLEQVAEELDERTLIRLLKKRLGAGPAPLLERARASIQQDFRDGEVEVVDGWQLSRTEAQLYALASLRIEGSR